MINLNATETSKWLKNKLFVNKKQIKGQILTVFNHSIIIEFEGEKLIHITNENINLSVFSIMVKSFNPSKLLIGDTVSWHRNLLIFNDYIIESNKDLLSFDETNVKLDDSFLNLDIEEAIPESIFREKFLEHRNELLHCLKEEDLYNFVYHSAKLIGLGDGLTPFGDDYILGLIYCLYNYKKKDHLQLLNESYPKLLKELTNKISKEFIIHALKGRFSKALVTQNWENLLFYGHNSGYFTLLALIDVEKVFNQKLILNK